MSATRCWLRSASIALVLSLGPRAVLADEHSRGGSGPAPEPEPARPHHPEPRVVVNVTSVKGPHGRKEVERAARLAWGRIVSCYEATGGRGKGVVEFELGVAGTGQVLEAKRTRSTFRNQKLEACLTKAWKGLSMPKARAGSIARAEIQLAPGDR
jgi:hypothetical protein